MSMPSPTIMDSSVSDDETLADSGFYWREADGVKVLVCGPLEDAGFANGFSTRLGGVSPFPSGDLNLAGFDEDTAANIGENRRRFLTVIGGGFELTTAWQVHGDTIKTVAMADDVKNTNDYSDSLVSDMTGVLVGVKTADCVSILIGDPATGAFAAIHAGWRGTVKAIAPKAVSKLAEAYDSRPRNLVAAMGPAACGRNYEVGHDVMDAFREALERSEQYFTPTRSGHAFVDLHLANRDQLISAGLDNANIYTAPFCTMERTDLFFSYRIEKQKYGKTGRLLSVIGRRS